MSEWGYIGAAYGLTWAVIIGYAVYLRNRIRRARDLAERWKDTGEVER